MLLTNAISVKLFLTFPRNMVNTSGSAAWIQCIYVSLAALLIFVGTYKLYAKCNGADIVDLAQYIVGKPMKIAVGLTLCAVLTANIAMTVRLFPESVKIYLLPNTPTEFILLFLAIAAAVGAYCEIEALSRLHAIIIPVSAVIMCLFFLLVLPNCRAENLTPILGTGAYNIFVRGFDRISVFSDILLLNLLLPCCDSQKTAVKCGFWAIVSGGAFALVITLLYAMAYPYPVSKYFIMPVYQLMRLVRVGDFFQRAESVFEFIWSISTMLYISVYICVICMVWQKIFDLKYRKPLIAPVTIIIFAIAFIPSSTDALLSGENSVKSIMCLTAFLLVPLLAVIYYAKGGHKNEKG